MKTHKITGDLGQEGLFDPEKYILEKVIKWEFLKSSDLFSLFRNQTDDNTTALLSAIKISRLDLFDSASDVVALILKFKHDPILFTDPLVVSISDGVIVAELISTITDIIIGDGAESFSFTYNFFVFL